MRSAKRVMKRLGIGLLILTLIGGMGAGAVRFYGLPLAQNTLATSLRALGLPEAVAEVEARGLSSLIVRFRAKPGAPVFGEGEVWPWSRSTLRLTHVRLFSLPDEFLKKTAEPSSGTTRWWERRVFLPPRLPYRTIVLDDVALTLPGAGDVLGTLTAQRGEDGIWTANLTFDLPLHTTTGTAHLQLRADGTYTARVEAQKILALSSGDRPVAGTLLFEGGRPNPVLSGSAISPSISLRLNPEQKPGLTALPVAADVPVPGALTGGPLHVAGSLNVLTPSATLRVTADSLTFPTARLKDLKATVSLPSLWPLRVPDNQRIFIQQVTVADFPLTDVRARVGYANGRVRVQRAEAKTLGGGIKTGPLSFSLPPRTVDATLTLEEIDLSQALVLAAVEGLGGVGRLSGTLPIRYDRGKISFGKGTVRARDAGRLAYAPAVPPAFLAEGGKGALLGKVFSDFRYNALSLTLSGTPGDTLTLGARLEGSNPSFYDGHPVSFTLTLSGDLDTVLQQGLKGLRLSPDALRSLIQQGDTPP